MKAADNTIQSLSGYFSEQLKGLYSEEEIRLIRNRLFEHFFQANAAELLVHPDRRLSESEMLKIVKATKDLKQFRPWQYITGETEFYGYPFQVNESVLIPRPETEELCQWVIEDLQAQQSPKLLDLGTGSGCIPITLKKQLPEALVSACDVSPEALAIARRNAENLAAPVRFFICDILTTDLEGDDWKGSYDAWISNPPYVLEADAEQMEANVLEHEPHLALFVKDANPLLFYHRIIELAQQQLKPGGKLYFEIHERYAHDILKALEQAGFSDSKLRKDLAGKDRMIRAQWGS